MDVMLGIAAVLVMVVGLMVSIALHEVGHLLPAKLFGVKVTQYMIGFGKTIVSWRRGETEYGFKWLPLGGYVRMIGMFPPRPGEDEHHLRDSSTGAYQTMADDARHADAELIAPGDEDRVFYKLSVAKKITIMLGGPLMNLLLAVVFLGGLTLFYGDPTKAPPATTTVQVVQECVRTDTTRGDKPCQADEPATPAAKAGLRAGDRFKSMDGQTIYDWSEIRTLIRDNADKPLDVVVDRGGRDVTLTLTPMRNQVAALDANGEAIMGADGKVETVEAGFIGFIPTMPPVPGSVTDVPAVTWRAFSGTAELVLNLPQRMVDVGQAAFGSEERDRNGPVGLVGVGRLANEVGSASDIAGSAKIATLVGFLGSLNMALFVFNLIPLLPLDGGHIAGATWEGLRRQFARLRGAADPGFVDVSKALPLIYVVATVMIAMSLLLLYADIVKPITLRG